MRTYREATTHIRARTGESFVVELRAHATSGYTWRTLVNPGVAVLKDERTRPGGAALGAPSIQEFEWVATHPGTGRLVMVCERPWESQARGRWEVDVTVDDAS